MKFLSSLLFFIFITAYVTYPISTERIVTIEIIEYVDDVPIYVCDTGYILPDYLAAYCEINGVVEGDVVELYPILKKRNDIKEKRIAVINDLHKRLLSQTK